MTTKQVVGEVARELRVAAARPRREHQPWAAAQDGGPRAPERHDRQLWPRSDRSGRACEPRRGDPQGWWCVGTRKAHDQPAHPGTGKAKVIVVGCDPECRARRLKCAEFADRGPARWQRALPAPRRPGRDQPGRQACSWPPTPSRHRQTAQPARRGRRLPARPCAMFAAGNVRAWTSGF
jgi:hypothetical protein